MKNRTFFSTILMLILCVLEQVSSIPYFSGIHLLFCVWLASTLIAYGNEASVILGSSKYKYLYIFLLFYLFAMTIATNFATGFARTVAMMETLSPVYMYDLYRIDKWNNKKYPFLILSAILLINISLSFTMIAFMGDTGLRMTVQADSDNLFKNALSILTSLALIIPVIIYFIAHSDKIHCENKIVMMVLSVVFAVVSLYLIFESFFITPLLVAVVGSVIAIIYGKKKWLIKSISAFAIIIILFLSCFSSIVSFVDGVSYGASRQLTPKLYELKYTLTGEANNAEDLSSRGDLATSSFKTFTENPLVGVSYKAKDYEETNKIGVGNHSEWLDDLALYGLFAIFLFIFLGKAAFEQIEDSKFSLSLLFFAFLGFNNPTLSFMNVCTAFLFIPIFFDFIKFDRS